MSCAFLFFFFPSGPRRPPCLRCLSFASVFVCAASRPAIWCAQRAGGVCFGMESFAFLCFVRPGAAWMVCLAGLGSGFAGFVVASSLIYRFLPSCSVAGVAGGL